MDRPRSANAVAILVLGILSWTGLSIIAGIPAWILGNQTLAAIERGEADGSEVGLVRAGRVLGMLSCILGGIAVALVIVAFGIGLITAISQHR